MTRSDRVRVLAWSLFDVLPSAKTATGMLTAGQPRKPSPDRWQVCGGCGGDGFTLDRFRRQQQCAGCGGSGRVRVDGYTGGQVASLQSPGAPLLERVGCAWCQPSHGEERPGRWDRLPRGSGVRRGERCAHCDGTGMRAVPRDADVAAAAGGSSLFEQGSYRELLAALRLLRRFDRAAYHAFVAVRVDGCDVAGRGAALERGDRFVDHHMPPRVRVPAGLRAAWETLRLGRTRDDRIRALLRRGGGVRAVAATVGVSVRTVQRAAYGRAAR